MRLGHRLESAAVAALRAGFRSVPWRASLGAGARVGDLARLVALRRGVAEENLARAFPERDPAERARILAAHYRELGRVLAEYARLPELARAAEGEVIAGARGLEHLERARAAGRGALLLTGHYGNFELLGAWLGRLNPVDFVVQALSNPGVDAMLARSRERAGVGTIPRGAGIRNVFQALRANRWVALVADQDARSGGVFVPFFGTLASTAAGPAELALRTGAPLILGFATRQEDGRHILELEPPLEVAEPHGPDAARRLTAAHTARLEARIRARPEPWFWLHRRWKTRPPADLAGS